MTPTFIWPTESRVITGRFADQRSYGQHNAIDIAAPQGAEVWAIADGRVVFADWAGSAGLSIWIDHAGGWRSHYCHLTVMRIYVTEWVPRGGIIARVGSTGDSTGPHLHLNLFSPTRPAAGACAYVPWVGKWAVDPLDYLDVEPRKEESMMMLIQGVGRGAVYAIGSDGRKHPVLNKKHQAALLSLGVVEGDRVQVVPAQTVDAIPEASGGSGSWR